MRRWNAWGAAGGILGLESVSVGARLRFSVRPAALRVHLPVDSPLLGQ
ncbi:hypothetical protein [Zestomonas thermotolerans]|nr:hypothetical protein [Pseudomonas thermotolerans]